jgi:low temperature requirement protein LtrA
VGAGIIAAALLAMAVAGALWWAYFDVVAIVAERRLRALAPSKQTKMARDSYTYLHLPMVTGIILFALGVKQTLAALGTHLHWVPALALSGGPALYLLALSTFKRRNIGSFNRPRLAVAALLIASIPLVTRLSALLALGLVALASCALIAYEVVRYAEARDRIRHGS